MAIYHLSVKTIGRSEGRSATAAAAYRAADKITDERTGEMHDYTRKGGVSYTEIVLPNNAPTWATNRAELWNTAEQSETRKNSTVAREFEIALPSELSEKERQRLAVDFAKEIVERHKVAADVAIHEPSRGGDNKNHQAHILITTRQLTEDGFTKKTRELDDRKSGEIDRWRERFAELQNERLKQNCVAETVDHRTLKAQGIDREPSKHLGVEATNYERRTGNKSNKRLDFEQQAAERLKAVTEIKELEREARQLEQSINETKAEAEPLKVARGNQAWNSYHDKKAQEAIERERVEQEKRQKELEKLEKQRKRDKEFDEKWERGLREARERRELQEELEREKRRTPAEWEKIANDELVKIFVAERGEWRKGENKRLLDEAEAMRTQAWALKAQEPSGLGGLFVTKKREKWEADLQRKIDEHRTLKQQAQDAIDGKSPNEREQIRRIEDKAREVFREKHPKLAQVLTDKAAREQAAREEKQREQKQERQNQAQKPKQKSRGWDMER